LTIFQSKSATYRRSAPMPMTPSVQLSLLALRGYLLLMTGLVAYHFLGLAAALRHLSS